LAHFGSASTDVMIVQIQTLSIHTRCALPAMMARFEQMNDVDYYQRVKPTQRMMDQKKNSLKACGKMKDLLL
jgi:hypothetical protein